MKEPQTAPQQTDRRQGSNSNLWAELVAETAWRPQDKPRYQSDGWLRAHGYLPDRREDSARPS